VSVIIFCASVGCEDVADAVGGADERRRERRELAGAGRGK
jgi:hypothetical protein